MELLSPSFIASNAADPAERTLLLALVAFTLTTGGLILLAVLGVFCLRLFHDAERRREQAFRERWEPLLFEAMGAQVAPPTLAPAQRRAFLELWLSVQSHIREEASENLNRLARAMGLDEDALRLARRRSLAARMLGVRALARLREERAWPDLERLMRSGVPALALKAAQAMVEINPARAFPGVTAVLRAGREWAPAQVVQILHSGGEHARQALAELLAQAQAADGRHLIRLLSLIHNTVMLPILRERAARTADPEELAEILHALGRLGGGEDREIVLRHLASEHWVVRMKAAQALGLMGESGDEVRLVALLADRSWWVRYRAAEALARLPGMSLARLRALRKVVADRYGRDILAQVIAETEPAA
ncbi:MAG TPA: HEAT repeat domain-containing protein [Burkholderiales bacterium]|nr:HEAT repeat domain-containing protein [Burkholderiales bacterium]